MYLFRPYSCSDCDFTAKYKWKLTNHQRKHNGERFSCPHCDYTHWLKQQVVVHMKRHKEAQPPVM